MQYHVSLSEIRRHLSFLVRCAEKYSPFMVPRPPCLQALDESFENRRLRCSMIGSSVIVCAQKLSQPIVTAANPNSTEIEHRTPMTGLDPLLIPIVYIFVYDRYQL